MDRQEIEQHAGVIENFLEGLPEKMFHLGIRVVLAALPQAISYCALIVN